MMHAAKENKQGQAKVSKLLMYPEKSQLTVGTCAKCMACIVKMLTNWGSPCRCISDYIVSAAFMDTISICNKL